jgi:ABC-2 type transport system ATP-binding protein
MSAVPAISVRGLTKSFGAVAAVADLSFDLAPATVTGFVGPNGSGKSTTIRMLLGLVAPTAGTASVLGHPISDPGAYLSRVGALVESPAFYPQLTGHRNLLALARLARLPPARVEEVLAVVGLAERARERYRDYSLGMKQRLGIAAALLQDPALLILDEPTNGLDPAGIVEIRGLLRTLSERGTSVFVSSHNLSEIQAICHSIVLIQRGRLLFSGSLDALLAGHGAVVLAAPEHAADIGALAALVEAAGYPSTARGDQLEIRAPESWGPELNRQAMRAGITLRRLGVRDASLEQTFLDLTDGTGGGEAP